MTFTRHKLYKDPERLKLKDDRVYSLTVNQRKQIYHTKQALRQKVLPEMKDR